MRPFDAVILAGGAATRMGGIDKPGLEIGGLSLLDRAIEAASGARRIVVVGPRRPVRRDVTWTMESPPLGGPVAAIAAALEHVTEPRVLVLAADLPNIDAHTVGRLVEGAQSGGTIAVDGSGRSQPLLAVYATDELRAIVGSEDPNGRAARVLTGMELSEVSVGRQADDCDTWDDFASAGGEGRIDAR